MVGTRKGARLGGNRNRVRGEILDRSLKRDPCLCFSIRESSARDFENFKGDIYIYFFVILFHIVP